MKIATSYKECLADNKKYWHRGTLSHIYYDKKKHAFAIRLHIDSTKYTNSLAEAKEILDTFLKDNDYMFMTDQEYEKLKILI